MTTLTELINGPWVQTLGWALLHSLWQGLAIMLLLVTVLRFVSTRRSELRYSVSYVAIFSQLITSVGTYLYLLPSAQNSPAPLHLTALVNDPVTNTTVSSIPFAKSVVLFLQMNMNIWITLWFVGTMIFITRIFIGWFYLSQLRRDSISIGDDWNKLVLDLSYRLGIRQYVSINESERITVPIVIGFFKPLILLPVGMLSGLSTDQVETILIHELVHVRRNDYIFNLLQSFIEAVFFFNPFVWIISNIIRTEREHCCDDAVVRFHGDPVTYVHALSRLEEVRLTKPPLALSLAKNKHYLLNRIKRLMEKSITKYPLREKMLPLAVLLLGLMCASWITIKSVRRKKMSVQKMKQHKLIQPNNQKLKSRQGTRGNLLPS